jgi:hypothetical protein
MENTENQYLLLSFFLIKGKTLHAIINRLLQSLHVIKNLTFVIKDLNAVGLFLLVSDRK